MVFPGGKPWPKIAKIFTHSLFLCAMLSLTRLPSETFFASVSTGLNRDPCWDVQLGCALPLQFSYQHFAMSIRPPPFVLGGQETINSVDVNDVKVADFGSKPPVKGTRKQHRPE